MAVTTNLGLTLLGAERRQPEVVVDANMQILDMAVSGNASGTIGCRVYHNTTQSITSATVTALALNSERFDTNVMHDVTTNNSRVIAKTAGKYLFTGNIAFATSAAGTVRSAQIRLNGSTIIGVAYSPPIAGGALPSIMAVTTIYTMALNDYVELIAYQDSGGALNVLSSANYSPEFMAVRLGA